MKRIGMVLMFLASISPGLAACNGADSGVTTSASSGSNVSPSASTPSAAPTPSPSVEENTIAVAPTGRIDPSTGATYCEGQRCTTELKMLAKKSDDGTFTIVNKSVLVLPDGYPVEILTIPATEHFVFVGKDPRGEIVKIEPGGTAGARVRSGLFLKNEVPHIHPEGQYKTIGYHMTEGSISPAEVQDWIGDQDRLSQNAYISEDRRFLVQDFSSVMFANGASITFNMPIGADTVVVGKDEDIDLVGRSGRDFTTADTVSINTGYFLKLG